MYKILRLIVFTIAASGFSLTGKAQTSWGKIDHKGEPWVKNISRPYSIERGLNGRHIALWASHGRYYDQGKNRWKWQRPQLFCTTEDLFTQTIVIPYLIPMLENAGAVVFTPRERDWQRHEVIVDNDDAKALVNYQETNIREKWTKAPYKGFASHAGAYHDGENPFEAGTARMAQTTKKKEHASLISYQPQIPEDGRYAVYVSYQTVEGSIDDAHYTVWHKGQKTEFRVNQQMGGSTWVYLGTFEFGAGCNIANRVELSNYSTRKNGIVTADAVRFGGGMGNIARGGSVSGFPRCLEGARYYAQWAGMPYDVYGRRQGLNDYADDINCRSLMTNFLTGGSCYAPDSIGLHVPIEVSLGVHSDAGFTKTGEGVYGTLTICTTKLGDEKLASGLSRETSKQLATALFNDIATDLQYCYGDWNVRRVKDGNYSETRLPIIPSAILETMSHQNFGDLCYGFDPNFRFTLARSIYKTLLRFITSKHKEKYVVQPLTPDNFNIEFTNKPGEIQISWQGLVDDQEITSAPSGYVLYIAQDNSDFDNGTPLRGTSCTVKLTPGVLYSFRIAATNEGGISFPSEVLTAMYNPNATRTAMIVNGFHRLSSPAISYQGQGFDLDEDPGVSYGPMPGFVGRQQIFDTSRIGIEDSTGLGFSGSELEGMFIAGNNFDHVCTHARAIRSSGRFNIVSCSAQCVENGNIVLNERYDVVDIILGLERHDGRSLKRYKTFSPALQNALSNYANRGGSLLVSGAYVGSDQTTANEQQWLRDVLKVSPSGCLRNSIGQVRGLGINFDFYQKLNEQHYAAIQADVLQPTSDAFAAMVYNNSNTCAAVAYDGANYKTFTIGFPFECVTNSKTQESLMRGILNFLKPN